MKVTVKVALNLRLILFVLFLGSLIILNLIKYLLFSAIDERWVYIIMNLALFLIWVYIMSKLLIHKADIIVTEDKCLVTLKGLAWKYKKEAHFSRLIIRKVNDTNDIKYQRTELKSWKNFYRGMVNLDIDYSFYAIKGNSLTRLITGLDESNARKLATFIKSVNNPT